MFINWNCDMLFDGHKRTKSFYDLGTQHFVRKKNGTENFSEAVYLDTQGNDMPLELAKQITPRDGQLRRFEEIFRVLGISNLSP